MSLFLFFLQVLTQAQDNLFLNHETLETEDASDAVCFLQIYRKDLTAFVI